MEWSYVLPGTAIPLLDEGIGPYLGSDSGLPRARFLRSQAELENLPADQAPRIP
jgi:hypothetical protein